MIYILKHKPVKIVVDMYNDAFKSGTQVDDNVVLNTLNRSCVPVDIDELYDDYNEYLADWLDKDHKAKETYMSFGEYLSEHMEGKK
jgi:hypothetical protein